MRPAVAADCRSATLDDAHPVPRDSVVENSRAQPIGGVRTIPILAKVAPMCAHELCRVREDDVTGSPTRSRSIVSISQAERIGGGSSFVMLMLRFPTLLPRPLRYYPD